MENSKENFEGIYEATGLLGMGGFLFYEIGCVFLVADPKNPVLRFHSDGIGDDFDISTSEIEGSFSKPVADLVGKCTFELVNVDFEEGGIELTIFQNDLPVGVFTGISEGVGEAAIKGKGKLTIPETKTHNNNIIFAGDKTIKSISFVYGDLYTITPGQPWGEVETTSSHNGSTLKIDIGAGRKDNPENAKWFNDVVSSVNEKMFHTRGGDNVPKELNFAIKGLLTINGDKFNVCIGQGSSGDYNNWHIASENASSKHPYKDGYIGKYYFSSDDSDEFKVTFKG
ncbi:MULTISPECIES: hypothetical protein [unclassified Flavobacterium]|uniref:hypothetical protein n=1 Tax=unclassified Flavobacterium TaxID=196869 RepID=UPI00131C90D7|nr:MULTISPECIES: hypothetical protein [unclassified Flavobacterium]